MFVDSNYPKGKKSFLEAFMFYNFHSLNEADMHVCGPKHAPSLFLIGETRK